MLQLAIFTCPKNFLKLPFGVYGVYFLAFPSPNDAQAGSNAQIIDIGNRNSKAASELLKFAKSISL